MNTPSNHWKSIFSCCLLIAGYFACTLSANEPERKVYENRECGIGFQYPEGWLVKEVPAREYHDKKQLCILRLQPKDLARHLKEDDDVDLYTIEILISKRNFDEAADRAGFERRETGWVVLGVGEGLAEEISSPQCIGLSGDPGGRCYHEGGGYAGECEMPRAVLNNRSDVSAIIYGLSQSSDVFKSVLKSFKFSEPTSGKAKGQR